MALSPQAKQILATLFGPLHLSAAELAVLTAENPQDLNLGYSTILADKKASNKKDTLTTILNGGAVTNWVNLTTLVTNGDGSTIAADLAAFNAAMTAKSPSALFIAAVALAISAKKLHEG